ncbi:MAG TPA: acetolactate synthase large subunit [Bryobacteraceae bacterium]|nr:acetolactate synthase large subunit [Bryobacteraceae bacterium]
MTGAESLLQALLANDITVCFMNPGTSEMHFVSALDRTPELRGVLCLFEGVCSGAADGYARMTGRPAATLLHLGPGLANALSNFHNARKARSPIVSIVGEHSRQHLEYDAPLSADIVAFARTVSTDVCVARSPDELPRAITQSVRAARRPPGQVATLIIPADLSWSEAPEPGPPVSPQARAVPDGARVCEAARLLKSRKSTGVLLSGSAALARGIDAAGRLAAAGARVFVDRNAARLASGRGRFQPTRIPYFPEPAQELLSGLEHLILVEAKPPVSFFAYPGLRSELAPGHCQMHVLAGFEEDGVAALESLADECGARRASPVTMEPHPDQDSIGAIIAELLPENAIVSDEMVSSGGEVTPHLVAAAPHDLLPVTGGSIGQGLPVALGAAVACPERKVVALEADGSGMYTLQSLWTIARERLDVTTVIFANRRYRILEIEMRRTGAHGFGPIADRMIDIGDPALDWVRLAAGMGVSASRAATGSEFRDQFDAAMQVREPRLIEAVLPF